MADVFTSTTQLSNQVQTAFDRAAYLALRSNAVFDQFARVKPGNVTSPGSAVTFLIWNDLAVATESLAETVDVDAVGLSDSTVTITPQEHGNAILLTIRLEATTYIMGFDADVANMIGFNLVDSLETLAEIAIFNSASTTAVASLGSDTEGQILATHTITLNDIRRQVAALRSANVVPVQGPHYAAVIHPDVSYDLTAATGDASWNAFHIRQNTPNWMVGEVGVAAGAVVLESPRARVAANAGDSNVNVYSTYFFGQEGLAKAETIPPHVVAGPVTDRLRRFTPLGWYAYLAYGALRTVALRRLISASSIGDND